MSNDGLESLGPRIRTLRQQRRLTLREMSRQTGLSQSFLSQFERGATQASISSLRRISSALGIPLGDLFDTGKGSGNGVLRAEDRPRIPFGENAVKLLLTPRPLEHIEVFHVVMDVDGSTGSQQYTHGDSDEIIVVLTGRLRVELASEVFVLGKDDSISFRSGIPHKVVNVGSESAEALWIIGPPGHKKEEEE
ncbi:helix-turn-helix transcriptional regulator [Thermobifida halotolerans]|uniref:Helix-turn-helix transcriptional regulator n=1 Tax=Thermobifida halotolerans TaxID=483545 RepID=A0A399G5P7_9ACTN|nr:XRE family transcriptional regulator [Thermobifida halotolerans]UOE20580.1 helix-turn-helix transcriptional regulator [Thermobifida halotolerans]